MTRLLFLILTCIPLFTIAQKPTELQFKVEYHFIHIIDKTKNDTLHNEKLSLRIGDNASYYSRTPLQIEYKIRELPPPPPSSNMIVVTGSPMAIVYDWGVTLENLYMDHLNKKIELTQTVGVEDYHIQTIFPKMDWNLSSESKTVGGYKCQKATGNFAGRNYTAWFTAELPSSAGPWKLNGLPGLILEAYDDKEEVFFFFVQLKKAVEKELLLPEYMKDALEVSPKEFSKIYDGFLQNPSTFIQAQTSSTRSVSMSFIDANGKVFRKEEALNLLAEKRKTAKRNSISPLELK